MEKSSSLIGVRFNDAVVSISGINDIAVPENETLQTIKPLGEVNLSNQIDESNQTETLKISTDLCYKCVNTEATHQVDPCGCLLYCKKCAMKMATGGKCKNCGQLFSSMKLLSR